MKNRFASNEQVESFLEEKGVKYEKLFYYRPVLKSHCPYWKVQVGKHPCEVYNLVDWANTIYK